MMLRFSIITCTYNSEKYLKETIESVCTQIFRNFEHIFIDAGSTDKTLSIIEDYKKKFPSQVHVFQQEPNGISSAMNYGVEKSSGEIICHLHSDDMFVSVDVLTVIDYAFMNNPQKKWLIGDLIWVSPSGGIVKKEANREYSYELLKRQNIISHPTVFILKDFFLKFEGFKNYKYAMDYDLWLRIGKDKPIQLHKFISKFRLHQGSLSSREKIAALKEEMCHRSGIKRRSDIVIRDYINFFINYMKLK